MLENKKAFNEPEMEIVALASEDVIVTSYIPDDWETEEFSL